MTPNFTSPFQDDTLETFKLSNEGTCSSSLPDLILGFPCGSAGKESTCSAGDLGSIPGWEHPLEKGNATHSSILAWRIPWTIYSPWGCKELDMTEWLPLSLSRLMFGEGNGNTLQYSSLENSMDRGAWRAIVPVVTKSWTPLSNWHHWVTTCTHILVGRGIIWLNHKEGERENEKLWSIKEMTYR